MRSNTSVSLILYRDWKAEEGPPSGLFYLWIRAEDSESQESLFSKIADNSRSFALLVRAPSAKKLWRYYDVQLGPGEYNHGNPNIHPV